MTSFFSIPRAEGGQAITATRLRDIVRAGIELQARLDTLFPRPRLPRGLRGPGGSAYLAPPPMPRLSLLRPALCTGGQVERYRSALSLLGGISLPPVGTLSGWYAIWCREPRMEGGALAQTPPRNRGWGCTELTADTAYTLSYSARRTNCAPRDVWYRDQKDGLFIPTYAMQQQGAETDLGLDVSLTEGEPQAGLAGVSGGFSAIPLGVIRWAAGEPFFEPLTKTLSAL